MSSSQQIQLNNLEQSSMSGGPEQPTQRQPCWTGHLRSLVYKVLFQEEECLLSGHIML